MGGVYWPSFPSAGMVIMRRFLLTTAALVALCHPSIADLVNNPGIFPSSELTTGNCLQATGQNTVTTTATPCGSGSGGGNVTGPTSSTIGAIPVWSNGTGTGLADSAILAANIPTLGANNVWGGVNSFLMRPIFNGATPWDSANFNPALYLLISSLPATLAPYLTIASATATYLTITAAQATYETIAAAQGTYLPLTGGTLSGLLTAPGYTLNGPINTWKPISFNTNGGQRWQIGSDNVGEVGANSGSNFDFFAYADNGAVLSNPLTIVRATGQVSMLLRPTWGGFTPWDSGNLNPATFSTPASIAAALVPYLKIADAATTYLTQANAAATYTTPAEVNAALANFLTIANAANTYLTIANAASAYLTQANAASTYLTQATAAATYATVSGVQSAYFRISGGTITGATAFNIRPTFNGATPWDSANLPSPLSAATAAATYMPLAGGIFTGGVQFNQTPTIANQALPVGDSSPDIGTTSWVQAVITARVGTNGPYIPLAGHGMPYDIPFTSQGLPVPGPVGAPFVVLQYVAVRSLSIPQSFAGSFIVARSPAHAAAQLTISQLGSFSGEIGTVSFPAGSTSGVFSATSGKFVIQPGDTITITTAINDTTLGGISGNILAVMN